MEAITPMIQEIGQKNDPNLKQLNMKSRCVNVCFLKYKCFLLILLSLLIVGGFVITLIKEIVTDPDKTHNLNKLWSNINSCNNKTYSI